MKRIYTTAIALSATLLLVSAAHAQVTLNSVRIGAKDTVAMAKFYQAAFGMQEFNRIDTPGGPEIFVNFGATIDAAKANKSEPIVIMHRDSDELKDPIAHVILNVKDMAATVAAIKKAGGSPGSTSRRAIRRARCTTRSFSSLTTRASGRFCAPIRARCRCARCSAKSRRSGSFVLDARIGATPTRRIRRCSTRSKDW